MRVEESEQFAAELFSGRAEFIPAVHQENGFGAVLARNCLGQSRDGAAHFREHLFQAGNQGTPLERSLIERPQFDEEREHLLSLQEAVEGVAAEHRISEDAPLALVAVPDTVAAVQLANAIAPEHLEVVTEDASLLAAAATTAGCVFIGEGGATAFGDYAAGSNHVLPTGGAGRFQGPLGPATFRRWISTVELTQGAARELAPTVATLARAEGFPLHAESAEARIED